MIASQLRRGDWFEREPGKPDRVMDVNVRDHREGGEVELYLKFGGSVRLPWDRHVVRCDQPTANYGALEGRA